MSSEWYLKFTRGEDTYYIYTSREETGAMIKRKLSQYTGMKVNEMRLVIPRYYMRRFENQQTVREMMLENGESLIVLFRNRETGIFEQPTMSLGPLDD